MPDLSSSSCAWVGRKVKSCNTAVLAERAGLESIGLAVAVICEGHGSYELILTERDTLLEGYGNVGVSMLPLLHPVGSE